MKFTYYSEQTLPKHAGGRSNLKPTISFNKSGVINFNKAAVELMKLKPGDKVTLAQDEDDTVNWYLFKDENGFELRNKEFEKKLDLSLNHKRLQLKIAQAFEYDDGQTRNFLVAGQPTSIKGSKTEYWGLIIKPVI